MDKPYADSAVKTYPTFMVRPYGYGLPYIKNQYGNEESVYWGRKHKNDMKGFESCCICGRKVNVGPKTIWAMVDVQVSEWSAVGLRENGSDIDLRLEPIGSDCAKKYLSR